MKAIKLALDQRLASMGSNNIAWENIQFKPTLNLMYLRPTLLNAESNMQTMEGIQRNPGIYQIDVFAPLNKGSRTVLEKMDEIYTHFRQELRLEQDGVTILIRVISQIGLTSDSSFLQGGVAISFDCYAD